MIIRRPVIFLILALITTFNFCRYKNEESSYNDSKKENNDKEKNLLDSLSSNKKSNDTVFISGIGVNKEHDACYNYFVISKKIEPNEHFNKVLSSFIYKALIGGYDCSLMTPSNVKSLSKRKSLKRVILLFFKNDSLKKFNIYETDNRWVENYNALLYQLEGINKSLLYEICDSLLADYNQNGLYVFWDECDFSKLKNIDNYKSYLIKNNSYLKLMEVSVIYHNSGKYSIRNQIINEIRKKDTLTNDLKKLDQLFNESQKIDRMTFNEKIYY